MKKQFLIFSTLAAIVMVSCSKQKIEEPQTNQLEEFAGVMSSTNKGKGGNPLDLGLVGRFEFDGNLDEKTGQLAPGQSTVGRVSYAADRKGNASSAIKFNGAYGINLYNVPLDTNMSVSFWIRKDVATLINGTPFVEGFLCFSFMQVNDAINSGYFNEAAGTSQSVMGPSLDGNWHHLTATRDANIFRFYVDGNLIGTSPTPAGSVPPDVVNDWLLGFGYNLGYQYWYGRMDDLRIYKRVLTTSEINKLSTF